MLAVALTVCTAGSLNADTPEKDRILMDGVMQRLMAVSEPPQGVAWPPVLEIREEDVVNAYATLKEDNPGQPPVPHIVFYRGLLDKVIEGKADRLAFIGGHELCHVLLGHCKLEGDKGKTAFMNVVFTREQELAADKKGMEVALAAGYNYKAALGGVMRMLDMDYSSFEGLSADHPSWKERMALLDPKQGNLWRSMGAFENGSVFLLIEQYKPAASCYYEVTTQFPDCAEGWSNLGYALLMQYCDGLDADQLRKLNVGQIVCGGFYRRSKTLEGALRGGDEELWMEAVESLEKALKLNPNLTLARANLGIAYLVDPSGPKLDKASQNLLEAAKMAEGDKSLDDLARASVLVNAGVADLAGGQVSLSVSRMDKAEALGRSFAGRASLAPNEALVTALLYNRAQALAKSNKPADAIKMYEAYLVRANQSSAWWKLALESYNTLCKAQKVPAKTFQAGTAVTRFRPLTSVEVQPGKLVTLADPVDHLPSEAKRVPVAGPANLAAYHLPGVDMLATDKVMGIRLSGPEAPKLSLKESGLGSKASDLTIGMAKADLEKTLANQTYDFRQLDSPEVNYRFYRDLGLAVLVKQGKVAELMVVQLPSEM